MKAEELMIGDWVYCEGQPTPDNVTIQSIHEDGVWFQGEKFEGAASYDRIFPIPLTPEILLKNGFKHDGMCSWEWQDIHYDGYHRIRKYIKVTPPDPDNEWKSPEDSGFIVSTNLREVNLADFQDVSVHHLQHFLRLCGINKTIEL